MRRTCLAILVTIPLVSLLVFASSCIGSYTEADLDAAFSDGYREGAADAQSKYDEGWQIGYDEGSMEGYENGYKDRSYIGCGPEEDTAYHEGYWDGYNEAQAAAYDEGYQRGYEEGYERGWYRGKYYPNELAYWPGFDYVNPNS